MRYVSRRRMGIPAFLLGFLFLALCIQTPLMAQSQPVTGTVMDPGGAAIPDATVTITDLAKNQVVKTTPTDTMADSATSISNPANTQLPSKRPDSRKQ